MKTLQVKGAEDWWQAAEEVLAEEADVVVEREGKPVARLTKITGEQGKSGVEIFGTEVVFHDPKLPIQEPDKRPRFDPVAHMKQMREFWEGEEIPDVQASLQADRNGEPWP